MKKRRFLTVLIIGLLCEGYGLSQQVPDLVAEQGYADMILVNGKIVTMDERGYVPDAPGHIYEAMAIKGKKVMALGTIGEIRRLAGPKTQTVDLGKKTVIPGLIANHWHIFSSAARRYGPQVGLLDLSVKLTVVGEKSPEATAKKIRDTIVNAIRVQKIPEGKWISVQLEEGRETPYGGNGTWLYMGNINRRQIDPGTESHPTIVKSGIYGLLNTAAVSKFLEEFPDWEESVDWENRPGSAQNGYAPVPEQQGITFEIWWKDEPREKLAEALRLEGVDATHLGITTVHTRLLLPSTIQAYNLLNREGRMPHRLSYFVESQRGSYFNPKSMREFYRASGAAWTNHANGGEMLWTSGMANEIWDSRKTEICMGPDLPAPPEIKDRERCPGPGKKPWDTYYTAILNGWRPVDSHGVGSHGVRLFIQMLELAMKDGGYSLEYMRSLRPTLEHNTLVGKPPDVIAGIKKFGIILNCHPTSLFSDLEVMLRDYGEKARSFAMPVKSWLEEGIRVTFEPTGGTDFWSQIYVLVTRRALDPRQREQTWLDEYVLPEEAIDRVSALKMATTWAAEYVLAEDTLGTLEPGKYADFVVLEKDFFTISVDEILGLQVVMTGLSGEIVYDRDQLAGAR